MYEEVHRIRLIGAANDLQAVVLLETGPDCLCLISCSVGDANFKAEAGDFFHAFCGIRRQLEKLGLLPFCYAASLNVYPSHMACDMALGLKAYRTTLGRHARSEDLVDIFSAGPDVLPASVDAQREFRDQWFRSPKTQACGLADPSIPTLPSDVADD